MANAKPMTLAEWRGWDSAPDSRERPFVSPAAAIRAKCLDCSGFNAAEVARCQIVRCPLWPHRFGRSPFHGLARKHGRQALEGPDLAACELAEPSPGARRQSAEPALEGPELAGRSAPCGEGQ